MDKEQLLQEGYREVRYILAKENKTIIFNDYMINRDGEVWSFKTGNPKILDGNFCHGYKMYSLCTTENDKNKVIKVGVYVLIASTFFEEVKINNIEDEDTFEVVHHIDHDKNNNSTSNLLWISNVEHLQLHSKSDITRKKKSEGCKGRHFSEEHRRKISENHADISGENNPMYGKHHTEETKQKIRENNPNSKVVIAYTDSGSYYQEFACIRDAEREISVNNSSISECCKGKRKSAGKITINGVIEKIKWRYK